MKNILRISILAVLVVFVSCQSKKSDQGTNEVKSEQAVDFKNFKSIAQFLAEAKDNLEQPVALTGVITHTCKHSGKRCFLADPDGKETVRVEAGGKIVGFNRELVGSLVKVTGTLKERRLSNEYIDQWEETLKEKGVKEDGTAETCAAENNNISRMRDWMKKHGKDYYSIYFIDGNDYEVVE